MNVVYIVEYYIKDPLWGDLIFGYKIFSSRKAAEEAMESEEFHSVLLREVEVIE